MIVADRGVVRKIEETGRAESVAGLPSSRAAWYHSWTNLEP